MDFSLDAEQLALRDTVRALLTDRYGDIAVRRRVVDRDPGYDESVWAELADMGVLGLPFPEEEGGMAAGPVEVGIVAQELGRALAPEPVIESVILAGGLIQHAGDATQRAEILGGISAGTCLVAAALMEPGHRWGLLGQAVLATPTAGGWTLSGVKEPVLNGARADLIVTSARLPDGGTGLFLVASDAAGLRRTGYRTHDGGRAARVEMSDTPATALGAETDQCDAIDQAAALARIAYCHEAIGAMETALDLTVGYLKSRKQFGVTLNTFQELRFRAADMYVALELATSTVAWATMVAAAGGDVVTASSRAKAQVGRALRLISQDAIQLHGGIGLTAEYTIGHVANRLTAIGHILGDGAAHRRLLADRVAEYELVDPLHCAAPPA